MDTREMVAKYGFAAIGVVPDASEVSPVFTYTVGMWPLLGYELLVFGLSPKLAAELFMVIYEEVSAGKVSLKLSVDDPHWGNLPCRFCLCDDTDELHDNYTCQADDYWQRQVPVVQVVLCDRQGRFYDHPQYDWPLMHVPQPLLFEQGQRYVAAALNK